MANPYLKSGEFIVLTTDRLSVNAVPFDAILTTERLILVDSRYGSHEPQVIPLSSILTVKAGQNAREDPVITLTFGTTREESTQKPVDLVFTQLYGEQRDRECNDWVRKCIEHIVLARKAQGSVHKSARQKDTGMRPLVRRWVAPEMIRPHTTEDAPPPEPEDFVIAPELLEEEPEPAGWEEFSGATGDVSGDSGFNQNPDEYPQPNEPGDEPAEAFYSGEETPSSQVPEPEPLVASILAPVEDVPDPVIPMMEHGESGAGPSLLPGKGTSSSTEPEIPAAPDMPEGTPEIPGPAQSPAVPSDWVGNPKPGTAAAPGEGIFSGVLKKLAVASSWTQTAKPGREPVPAGESTSAAGTFSSEMTPVDENVLTTDEPAREDHTCVPETFSPPEETRDAWEQPSLPPDKNDTAIPDPEPVRSSTIPIPVVPAELLEELSPVVPEIPITVSETEPAAAGPSRPHEPEDMPPKGHGAPARAVPPSPPGRRFPLWAGVALLVIALLVIAGAAILLTMPLISKEVPVNASPVMVTPSIAPVVTTTTPLPIPLTGTWVRVMYNGTFVGLIGDPNSLQPISGTGDQIYSPQMNGDLIKVSIQKQDYYGETLSVWIYTNGAIAARQSTRVPHGTIDLLIDTRTGYPPGVTVPVS